jgi:hypothetical protein
MSKENTFSGILPCKYKDSSIISESKFFFFGASPTIPAAYNGIAEMSVIPNILNSEAHRPSPKQTESLKLLPSNEPDMYPC